MCRDDLKQEVYIIFSFPSIIAMIAAGTCAIAFTAQYWLWKEYEIGKPKIEPMCEKSRRKPMCARKKP